MQDEASQSDSASIMSEEPPEQSGYPIDPAAEEEDQHGQSSAAEGGHGKRQARWGTVGYGHLENHMPDGNTSMQRVDHSAFLAAVKKQSKVKEGDWSEVRQHRGGNENEDGMVDID